MRRIASALVVVAVVLVSWVAPASGSSERSGRPSGLRLTGTFSGTSTWEFSDDPACSFVVEQYTGTYDPDRRGVPGGTYAMDACVSPGNGLELHGSFTVDAGHRRSLSGTVDGVLSDATEGLAIDATLTVTDSRGWGRPVRGTIVVAGIRTSSAFGTSAESGTFTADLHRVRR